MGASPPRCSASQSAAAIYIRVSTLDQGKKYSPESQRHETIRCAESKGLTVSPEHVYEDHETGTKATRRNYRRMLDAAEAGEFSTILIWKSDRLGRDEIEQGRAYHELKAIGVKIWSVSEGIDFYAGPVGKFVYRQLGLVHELVRDIILENSARGRAQAARTGHRITGSPYGYADHRLEADGKIRQSMIPHPQEAPVVRALFLMYAAGESINGLAALLTRRGIPKRARMYRGRVAASSWSRTHIWKILRNPVYAGYIRHRTAIYRGVHEPLVSEDVYNVVQRELARGDCVSRRPSRRRSGAQSRITALGLEDRVRALHAKGMTDPEIARALGLTRHMVQKFRYMSGLAPNR